MTRTVVRVIFLPENHKRIVFDFLRTNHVWYRTNVWRWKYESKDVPLKYKNVYKIIGNMPMDINTICRRAELPIQDVSEQLTMLELNEYIRALPGDMFVKVWIN